VKSQHVFNNITISLDTYTARIAQVFSINFQVSFKFLETRYKTTHQVSHVNTYPVHERHDTSVVLHLASRLKAYLEVDTENLCNVYCIYVQTSSCNL